MKGRFIVILIFLIPVAGYSQSLSVADSLHSSGMKYRDAGHYGRSSEDLGKAYHIYKNLAADSVWAPAGYDYAVSLTNQSRYKQAFDLLRFLNETTYAKRHIHLHAKIENEIGLIYFHTSREDSALQHLNKAITLAKKAGDPVWVGAANNNIGAIYLRRGNYAASLNYRKKALAAFQKANKKKYVAILLNNIGFLYYNLFLYDKALKYYRRSLSIKKSLEMFTYWPLPTIILLLY